MTQVGKRAGDVNGTPAWQAKGFEDMDMGGMMDDLAPETVAVDVGGACYALDGVRDDLSEAENSLAAAAEFAAGTPEEQKIVEMLEEIEKVREQILTIRNLLLEEALSA